MKSHWFGGIVFANGNRLPGWPCCCTGEQAEKIAKGGWSGLQRSSVTCKKCLAMMEKQDAFKAEYPDIWEDQRSKGYTS